MSHTWPFFNSQFPTAESGTGADRVELYKSNGTLGTSPNNSSLNVTTKEAKRLSLQLNQSRSFGKGESPSGGPSVAQKGYRTFNAGEYMYNFELPLDSHLPETIDVDLGSVKYELEATVERAGAFRTNLIGTKEVTLIRAPSEGSLEQVEPIAISRSWEDQLHYDIVISGKSFPLGAQVPIAFKLTPLAKVQCHRIKVFVTENVEYFCNNKRVHRMEPIRKVQLFEKRADSPPTSTFPGSTMRIVSGGGVSYDQRAAASRGEDVQVADPTNLLGDLGGDANIGPTEMEFNVQLPSCHNMREKDKQSRLHFDTTYQNIQVHHWIKVCFITAIFAKNSHLISAIACHATFETRCNRSHQEKAFRNLHRLSFSHPIMPGDTSKHSAARLLVTRAGHVQDVDTRLRMSKRTHPTHLAHRFCTHVKLNESFTRRLGHNNVYTSSRTAASSTHWRANRHSCATAHSSHASTFVQPACVFRRGATTTT